MQSRFVMRCVVWAALYTFFILGPLFALLAGSHPPARDFWTEFSVALGYAGLAMMGLQFGLTARFRYVTEPWGEDVIYHFHRQMSLIAVGLVLAHPIILFVVRPELLVLLNSFTAPWRARFAALSTYSLIALVVTAVWRVKLNIRYETWHISHIVLAVLAVGAGVAHMVGWSFYLADPWKRGCGSSLLSSGSPCCFTSVSSSRFSCSADHTASQKCARSAVIPGQWRWNRMGTTGSVSGPVSSPGSRREKPRLRLQDTRSPSHPAPL